jgi:phosphatidylethanolamine/phosphatidyl-N-methylethanolamine N-methyltransferase
MIDQQATTLIKARYNRIAGIFDAMEVLMEFRAKTWRQVLWNTVQTGRILDVGVGTGKNLPYYPKSGEIVGIDLSDRMLAKACQRAKDLQIPVELREMDAQALNFPDDSFDTVVASFVFCSVPDPVLGLRELGRVVKPAGKILLLEHVRLEGKFAGLLMDLLNPLVVRLVGANINRRTVENVRLAGLKLESVEDLTGNGLIKLIQARKSG